MKTNIRTIHFYGDSLTSGYGAAYNDSWIPHLSRRFPTLSLYNHGQCGAGLSEILAEASAAACHPSSGEVFFLMGGTNDILSGRRYASLLSEASREIQSLSASISLILGIPILATRASITAGWQAAWQYGKNNEELTAYAEFLRRLAESLSLPVLDFQKALPLDDAFYTDGLHPNAKGYERFAETAAQWIETQIDPSV